MKYLNEVDGLKVVMSLRDFNELVDELRMLTMPPVLAGLERLDASDRFIAGQLEVPELTIAQWKTGKVRLMMDRQVTLCVMLERGIKIYEDVLAEYESDTVEREFYEIGVLREHIRCAEKLLSIQREMIAACTPAAPQADAPEPVYEADHGKKGPADKPEIVPATRRKMRNVVQNAPR